MPQATDSTAIEVKTPEREKATFGWLSQTSVKSP